MHEKTAILAVGLASAPMALSGHTQQALLSIALGLSGVALARAVFINKERRTNGTRPPLRETLPLTLAAMLITAVVVWDRELGPSFAVFTGLGVGWSVILLLDVLGGWILTVGRRIGGVTDKEYGLTAEQSRLLNALRDPHEEDTSLIEDQREDKTGASS